MPHGQTIASHLLSIGAVKLSLHPPFTWTSGIKSPIYCDNRMMYSHPVARDLIVTALVSRVKSLMITPDVIAGTATAAIGWAALVADRLKLPFVYVRSTAKEHGAKKRIEGDLKPGLDIVVIEDLISTGGSSVSTVTALREEGQCRVSDIVSIFSYDLPEAQEKAQENSVRLYPLCSLGNLLMIAVANGSISKEDLGRIADFAKDPENWGKSL